MRTADETEFRDYVTGHLAGLRRTAYLLCGDWHQAEDIVQTALTKLYLSWRRVRERGALDSYVRQIVVRTYIDEGRRGWRRERPTAQLPDSVGREELPDDRMFLLRALAQVPSRQRAALVLRFWEDLSVEETAHALGCSEGTVKSSTARGLDNMREVLARQGVIAPKGLS